MIQLGAQGRAALKAHITSLPGWRDYRTQVGKTASEMSAAELVEAAEKLGVDVSRFAKPGGSAPAPRMPVVQVPAKADMAPAAPDVVADIQAAAYLGADLSKVGAAIQDAGKPENLDAQDATPAASADPVDAQVQAVLSTPMGQLSDVVRDLVLAANKPAEVKEVVREVKVPVEVVKEVVREVRVPVQVDGTSAPVSAPAVPVMPERPDLSHIKAVRVDRASKVFGISGGSRFAGMDVELWNDPEAPAVDPHYEFDADWLEMALTAASSGENFWMGGPAGTGKTTFAKQFAARTGRAFYRINHTRTTEPQDLIGGKGLVSGSTRWEDGSLTAAIRRPGAVVLVDEPTMSKPGTLAVYHPILDDDRMLTIPDTGERVPVAPGVVFFAADNTMGMGDDTGQYLGTENTNRAFLDRWGYSFRVSYLPKAKEVNILTKRTGCPRDIADILVDFARLTRTAVDQDEMTVAVGLRRLVPWAKGIVAGANPMLVFTTAVVNQLDQDNQERARQLYNANVNEVVLTQAVRRMRGEPDLPDTAIPQDIDPDVLSQDSGLDII